MYEAATCLTLATARLLAGDLAAIDHAFAALPAAQVLAWAPSPGAQRWLTVDQLRRWAPSTERSAPLCIERAAAPVARDAVERAVRAALGEAVPAELVDWARQPYPPGQLRFELRTLPRQAAGVVLWRGLLEDVDRRRYPFWVRLRTHVVHPALRLRAAAAPGVALTAAQLEEFEAPGPPPAAGSTFAAFTRADEAVGCHVRRALPAGTTLTLANLRCPAAVERGDEVAVAVEAGAAALALTARAQTAGQSGDLIWLENPSTRRRFRARVSGPRQARIDSLAATPKENTNR